jgi:hypothetical protein
MYRRSLLDQRGLGWIVDLNPVNLYLSVIRDPLLMDLSSDDGLRQLGYAYLAALVFTTVLAGLAIGVVGWLHKKVIFHL